MNDLRVCAYCRVSTFDYSQQDSLKSQIEYFSNLIKGNENWKLTEVYFDEGLSGTNTSKREGFLQMINDALNNKFDLIITKEVSRFARNTVDTLTYTRKLSELNIGVYFINDNINTLDKDGELRLTIMASLAQEESRKTSERVKWGQARKMEQGVVFGTSLLGYSVNGGKLTINNEQAKIVKYIYERFNFGLSCSQIANELDNLNIPSFKNKGWNSSTILKILKNEKYMGDLCQKKTFTLDYLTHQKKYNHSDNKIYIHNHHEPIISKSLWEKTKYELKKRSENGKKHSNKYWCSKKLICYNCKNTLICKSRKLKNGDIYRAWICNHCKKSYLNNAVLSFCTNHILNLDLDFNADIITSINSKLKLIESKKTRAISLHLDNLISKADLELQLKSLKLKQKDLNKRLINCKNKTDNDIFSLTNSITSIIVKQNTLTFYLNFKKSKKIVYHCKGRSKSLKINIENVENID